MIGQIRDGVSLCLAKAYPEHTIYGDARVKQGLLTPCFFVGMGECTERTLPNGMREIRQMVEVVCFPEEQGEIAKLWEVGSEVMTLLSTLTLADGSKLTGVSRRCMMQDDLMHVYAVYYLRLRPVQEYGMMEELLQQTML